MKWLGFFGRFVAVLFGPFPEVEQDLDSEPTKEAGTAAKGKSPGRPKGFLGTSELDGRDEEIELLLKKGDAWRLILAAT